MRCIKAAFALSPAFQLGRLALPVGPFGASAALAVALGGPRTLTLLDFLGILAAPRGKVSTFNDSPRVRDSHAPRGGAILPKTSDLL